MSQMKFHACFNECILNAQYIIILNKSFTPLKLYNIPLSLKMTHLIQRDIFHMRFQKTNWLIESLISATVRTSNDNLCCC